MAGLASLITGIGQRTRFRDYTDNQDLFLIDVTISETAQHTAEVTDNPVEDGPDVTDHIRPLPTELTIEGMISETPLTLSASLAGAITAGAALAGPQGGFGPELASVAGAGIGTSLLISSNNPASIVRTQLESMIKGKVLFTIVFKNRKYSNMTFTSLTFPRDKQSAGALFFTAKCKEVNIVKGEVVTLPRLRKAESHSAAKKTDLGSQQPKDPTPQVEAKSSALVKLGQLAGFLQ